MSKNTILSENIAFLEERRVQPSRDQLITLTIGQLMDIVQEAIQPLQDHVSTLDKKIESLKATVANHEKNLGVHSENDLIQLRLINELRHKNKQPGTTESSRAEKIEKYLQTRPDHKATFETLKGHLGIGKALLYQTIQVLMAESPGRYAIIKTPGSGDKRKKTLVMLPR